MNLYGLLGVLRMVIRLIMPFCDWNSPISKTSSLSTPLLQRDGVIVMMAHMFLIIARFILIVGQYIIVPT